MGEFTGQRCRYLTHSHVTRPLSYPLVGAVGARKKAADILEGLSDVDWRCEAWCSCDYTIRHVNTEESC
jgi:hypothetical protein